MAQYAGLKHGKDQTDARHLAHLLRLGLLPEGYIYPREPRGVHDLLRRRFLLVRQSVTLTNSLQCAWSRRTGHGIRGNDLRQISVEVVNAVFADMHERLAVLTEVKLLECLHTQVDPSERWILESILHTPGLQALRSVPRVGVVLGSTIMLETGEIGRFASVGEYASYCRMVESTRWSNGKPKGSSNAKSGNRYLSWAWIEAANFAIRFSPEIRRWFDRKASKKTRVVAIKAVADKLARAGYHLMKDGGHFDVKRAFGQAPRWRLRSAMGLAKPPDLNDPSDAGSDSRRGPPARRANQGLGTRKREPRTCAADLGHMDAWAEPMSVWGSDAEGGRTAYTRMVTGAALGRSQA